VVSAPSGCGKTTIRNKLASIFPNLASSISMTTRPPRSNEVEGKDYYFVSKKDFLEHNRNGELLEWACNFGHLYGTPRSAVQKAIREGKDILLTIDVKGAKKVKMAIPGSIHIFLMPPSIYDLEKRLKKRGTDNTKDIHKRLNVARREIEEAKRYDYIVVNDSIKSAVSKLKSIIEAEKKE